MGETTTAPASSPAPLTPRALQLLARIGEASLDVCMFLELLASEDMVPVLVLPGMDELLERTANHVDAVRAVALELLAKAAAAASCEHKRTVTVHNVDDRSKSREVCLDCEHVVRSIGGAR